MTKIGLVGGTGDLGPALAVHLAKKKYDTVMVGSRSKEKAESTVHEITRDKGDSSELKDHLEPSTNDNVVSTCDVVIVTVPFNAAVETITSLKEAFKGDQLLISAAAGMRKIGNEFTPVQDSLSVSSSIQDLLRSKAVSVAAAFQTIPAVVLYREQQEIDADVPVCCNEQETYARTAQIVSSIKGLRPLYAGSLNLSQEIEGLTALLLNISIRNRLKSPTFKIHSF